MMDMIRMSSKVKPGGPETRKGPGIAINRHVGEFRKTETARKNKKHAKTPARQVIQFNAEEGQSVFI